MDISIGVALGLTGALMTLISFLMKDMLRLRMVALVGSVVFLAYGFLEEQLPSIILNCILIPLNLFRVIQTRSMIKHMAESRPDSPLVEWLLPLMHLKTYGAGKILFKKGEKADRMLYIKSGEVRLIEIDKILGPGNLIGEIGLFTPDATRTLSIECISKCELASISRDEVLRLSYNNPEISHHLAQLIIGRLIDQRKPPPRGGKV